MSQQTPHIVIAARFPQSPLRGAIAERTPMKTCLKDLSPGTSRRSWTTER